MSNAPPMPITDPNTFKIVCSAIHYGSNNGCDGAVDHAKPEEIDHHDYFLILVKCIIFQRIIMVGWIRHRLVLKIGACGQNDLALTTWIMMEYLNLFKRTRPLPD